MSLKLEGCWVLAKKDCRAPIAKLSSIKTHTKRQHSLQALHLMAAW
jgi:hypothetical protein